MLSTLNATAQVLLPAWTRARALAYYQLVLMGGQAFGAVVWGAVGVALGVRVAMVVPAAAVVLVVLVAARLLPLTDRQLDTTPASAWDAPPEIADTAAGPVLVAVEWRVPAARTAAFTLETFTVDTWHEHLRQHLERGTAVDVAVEAAAREPAAGPPRVRHLLWAWSGADRPGPVDSGGWRRRVTAVRGAEFRGPTRALPQGHPCAIC